MTIDIIHPFLRISAKNLHRKLALPNLRDRLIFHSAATRRVGKVLDPSWHVPTRDSNTFACRQPIEDHEEYPVARTPDAQPKLLDQFGLMNVWPCVQVLHEVFTVALQTALCKDQIQTSGRRNLKARDERKR